MSLTHTDLHSTSVDDHAGNHQHATAPGASLHPLKGGVRPLKTGDREPLRQLLVETDVFAPAEIDIALELIDCRLNDPAQKDYIVYVFDEEEEVLGYYCIGPTPATHGTFDLYWIAVKPSAHKRGIGAVLIAHAELLIRSQEGRLVIAETSSQPKYDKTRRFYLNQGYVQLARIRDYYSVGDDLVVYGKYLT